jgi:hypothetical protein
MKLRRKWRWSPWRILPLPILAFLITGLYLSLIDTPDAWLRAIGPVLTVGTYVTIGPVIRSWWFAREQEKIEHSDIDDNDLSV